MDILERARATQLSDTLLKRQLRLFGHIALQPPGDPLRALLFVDDGLNFGLLDRPRRRGRPAQYWPETARQHAVAAANGFDNLKNLLDRNEKSLSVANWDDLITSYVDLI